MNNSSSWEEIAFAEDAAGALGGCVWPPRSYSCSFCRREFRSAQALGGHMNIHRRDRARLKQISHHTSAVESVQLAPRRNHLYTDLNCTSFDDLVHRNPNNPEFTSPLVSSIPSHGIGVSGSASENTSSSLCFLTTGFGKKRKDHTVPSQFSFWSSFVSGKSTENSVLEGEQNEKSAVLEPAETRLETANGLSESLNLAVCKTQSDYAANVEEVASCKRRRIEAMSPAGIFEKLSTSMERCLQSEAFKHCSGATEGLDLELRLGNAPPKVK